jgi:hypothetical protein
MCTNFFVGHIAFCLLTGEINFWPTLIEPGQAYRHAMLAEDAV